MVQDLTSWIQAISQLLFIIFLLAFFLGLNQRIQLYIWTRDIRGKLTVLEGMAEDARRRTLDFLVKNEAKNPETTLNRITEFFVIQPVSIEPVDIIKRLDVLVNLRNRRFKEEFARAMPGSSEVVRSKAEVLSEITAALTFLFKAVRHYLLLGEKTRNWVLIMQLQLLMPELLKMADTYRKALNDFLAGYPIGDSAGPLVAAKLANYTANWKEIEWETVSTEVNIEGRRVILVKAKGPMPTVGKPGSAVEKLVREMGERPNLLLTVDAALKLEGEESGSVVEGVGAAIGDIGPEKIRFERVAAEYNIPLRALVIKMSMEEAISAMNKQIYEGVERAVQRAKEIIISETKPGDTAIVAGIGNTSGVL
ncbi:MAG: DUF1512 domain-containing protein [Acidilobaceae archaeon]|nr:DUF1512 domain-containing protein [Acidilobaceae archaeon]MDW7973910.1 DUF1512 domain-containing protein [Sulfolobales archaeon]